MRYTALITVGLATETYNRAMIAMLLECANQKPISDVTAWFHQGRPRDFTLGWSGRIAMQKRSAASA